MNGHAKIALALLLFSLTIVAFFPTLFCGFIWDDDDYVTNNRNLRSAAGLGNIWFAPFSSWQYYPLVHTTYWLEYRLWGPHPAGFHLTNILLHAFTALLIWRVLVRLTIPGAWLAAAIFAVHPVHVESVAWITERKNVLSGIFYFASLLAYLRYARLPARRGDDSRRFLFYSLSLLLFAAALLSKSVTSTLPAAILLLIWWSRGEVRWRDLLPLAPMLMIAAAAAAGTIYMEKIRVGAQGAEWDYSLIERCLIAGRAAWFYATKLIWPHPLIFNYPRWQIDAGEWRQWIFVISAVALIAGLWRWRRNIGRGPLTAVLFFGGSLFPALGFFDVYPMRFSFVADHFQYIASLGIFALVAGVVSTSLADVKSRLIVRLVYAALLLPLVLITWNQIPAYKNQQTLWQDTLAKNPESWLAHNNLGLIYLQQGKSDDAALHFTNAVEIKPDFEDAHNNLGLYFEGKGDLDAALFHYQAALDSNPNYAISHNNLANVLLKRGEWQPALGHYRRALEIYPDYGEALQNLGFLYEQQRDYENSLASYRGALRLRPESAKAHTNIGFVYEQMGDFPKAKDFYQSALRIDPDAAEIHVHLGRVSAAEGDLQQAAKYFREAIRINPSNALYRNYMGIVLARQNRFAEAQYEFEEALRIDPDLQMTQENLERIRGLRILADEGQSDD